jgi:mannose-6-phosphate isomerase-like protein (cupin superfamily)
MTSLMPTDTINPVEDYLLLEPDGTACVIPGGGEFWRQLMSGKPTDPGIQRLMASDQGRLLTVLSMSADWTRWEMHPAGDEVLYMLEGKATFLLGLASGSIEVELGTGRLLLIPKGIWHTAKLSAPARLLAITVGSGTQHRPD